MASPPDPRPGPPPSGGGAPTDDEIEAFQTATRDLIGVALRSLEVMHGEVSLPQLRLLLVLHDLGPSQSSHVAHALGLGASSVTRLADRLVASGHIVRGGDPHHRSVVTLALSPAGRRLVTEVLDWRRTELARILAQIGPEQRAATAAGMRALHRVIGETYTAELHGPVPL